MPKDNKPLILWENIDTVLLDMDGTLLDLYFDNYFWQEHLPQRYAERKGLTLAQAKAELHPRFEAIQGTMRWYCVDYWSSELGLDVALLKEEVSHLISLHPHVIDFLRAVRDGGRRAVLVTNAHQKSLALKMKQTRLGEHLDAIVCAHDVGIPKEQSRFWGHLRKVQPFEPDRTLLIDDNLAVLASARRYGIGRLLAVRTPDTRHPPRITDDFPALRSFREIMPATDLGKA